MRTAKVIQVVIGAVLALTAAGILFAGGALTWWHATAREGGWYTTDRTAFDTDTYALTSREVDLFAGDERADIGPLDHLGTVRLRVDGSNERPLFVGIARADDVERFLAGVRHEEVLESDRTRLIAGDARPSSPTSADIWVASSVGTGQRELRWELERGEWVAVVMNADAAAGIDVSAAAAVRTDVLLVVGLALLLLGALAGAAGAALLVSGLREPRAATAVPAPVPAPVASPAPERRASTVPVRISGALDPELSRWLWLVKWFLAIPHLVVLALLWPVMVVTTIAAGVAILFTGRYPTALFDFGVGVLRWTWRVTFYAFVLGTDRYPPFTLAADADFPAQLEVDHVAPLSRGLVLVKSWLLAIPHLLVLAVFGGGLSWWAWSGSEGSRPLLGGGLIGLLALVAGVSLLFTGRYPVPVFDFVMGMERWTYRVLAYVALMHDEYPPFRLDPGGADPASSGAPGPSPFMGPGRLREA